MSNEPASSLATSPKASKIIKHKSRKLASILLPHGMDECDIAQAMRAHLVKVEDKYDPAKGSVSTFVENVLDRFSAELLRNVGRKKRRPDQGVVSLGELSGDDPDEPGDSLFSDPALLAMRESDVDLKLDIEAALSGLPTRDRRMAILLTRYKPAELGHRLRMSKHKIAEFRERLRGPLVARGLAPKKKSDRLCANGIDKG